MKVCPSCQTRYDQDKKFCRGCGVQLTQEKTVSPEQIARRHIFESRLTKDPENPELLTEYGSYLVSVGLFNDGLPYLFKALEVEPGSSAIRRKIIGAYRAMQDFNLMAAQILILLEDEPDDLSLLEELAYAYLSSGRTEAAADTLARMSRLAPRNLDLIRRRLDLLRMLVQNQEIVASCEQFLALQPDDLSIQLLMADALRALGRQTEALLAYKKVLDQDGSHPRANLYVGIIQHDQAVRGQDGAWSQAAAHLDRALARKVDLPAFEASFPALYIASLRLRTGKASSDLTQELFAMKWRDLDEPQARLMADCCFLLGDLQLEAGMAKDARRSYELALEVYESPKARRKLAEFHHATGEQLLAAKRYTQAQQEFSWGLSYLPDDPQLLHCHDLAETGKKRRVFCWVAATVGTLLMASGMSYIAYYGRSGFDIMVSPEARISVLRSGSVVAVVEASQFHTTLLRFGSYQLVVEKEGYETVRKPLKASFGRKFDLVEVKLSPAYGSLKVASDPTGARVEISNKYQKKSAETPCEIKSIFAAPTNIRVSLPDYVDFKEIKPIPNQGTLDLGTIRFKGSLRLDSNPSAAEVYVDGLKKGETPLLLKDIPAKKIELLVQKSGIGAYLTEVIMPPNGEIELGQVTLSRFGFLRLQSDPPGAEVWLDNQNVGTAPMVLDKLEPGARQVILKPPNGMPPFKKELNIREGEVIDLGTVSFAGAIKVASFPSEVEVYLDGEKKGQTPLTIEQVPAKDTALELRLPGQKPYAATIQVPAGKTLDLGIISLDTFARRWSVDWKSLNHYGGTLVITNQIDPNHYLGKLSATWSGRKVVLNADITVNNDDVRIVCSNPSDRTWSPDIFQLKKKKDTMEGYSQDQKGRRGKATFTKLTTAGVAGSGTKIGYVPKRPEPPRLPEPSQTKKVKTPRQMGPSNDTEVSIAQPPIFQMPQKKKPSQSSVAPAPKEW